MVRARLKTFCPLYDDEKVMQGVYSEVRDLLPPGFLLTEMFRHRSVKFGPTMNERQRRRLGLHDTPPRQVHCNAHTMPPPEDNTRLPVPEDDACPMCPRMTCAPCAQGRRALRLRACSGGAVAVAGWVSGSTCGRGWHRTDSLWPTDVMSGSDVSCY